MTAARRLTGPSAEDSEPAILVVDDDPQVRQTIRFALESEGLRVAEAAGHRDALAAAAPGRVRLVMLDITLPGSDSSQLAAALRSTLGDTLPILVITADGHAAEKGERVGAFACLRKPFDLGDFLTLVRNGLTAF